MMSATEHTSPRPLRVLIAEDQALIATTLEDVLIALGAEVVGPVSSVATALALVARDHAIDAALLDVNLDGEAIYPVADALLCEGCSIAFVTGYGRDGLDRTYNDVPVLTKPYGMADLQALLDHFEARRALHSTPSQQQ